MRNRIRLVAPILVTILLVACNEPAAETTDVVVGEPINVGGFPHLATDAEFVWVTSEEGNALVRIDPAQAAVTGGLQALGSPMEVAVLDDHVWVAAESWLEIDRDAVDIVDSMPAMAEPYHVEAGFGSLWAVGGPEHVTDIRRIDPRQKEVTAHIPIEGVCAVPGEGRTPSVIELIVSDDAVWALTFCDGDPGYVTVYRIDPSANTSNAVAVIDGEDGTPIGATAIAVVDGTPWVTTFEINFEPGSRGRLVRIDADAGTFEEAATVGRWPRGVVYANGFLWVTDCADATVTQVDPTTGDVVGDPTVIATPAPDDVDAADEPFSCPAETVVHGNTLWVCTMNDGTVIPVELSS
jgi:streptogramin lyase